MKNSYFQVIVWLLSLNTLLFLSGCGGGSGDKNNTPAILTSISITPTSPGIVQGATQQFTATGTYSDNSTNDVTLEAGWASSNTSSATVSDAGLATGTGVGISTIEASLGGKTNSTQIIVTAAAVAPVITSQPASQSVLEGQTAAFNVTASGTAPLTYQWKKNGVNIGTNASSYTTPVATLVDNGAKFSVVVSNTNGSVTSNEANLTVTAVPIVPTISIQPTDKSVTEGQTATFSVVASGTFPLAYQWKKDGVNIGTNASSYTTSVTTLADNGARFSVVVSNSSGNVTSAEVTLTVTALPAGVVRIAYLHHSTGGNIWAGGIPAFFTSYNTAHSTQYQITSITYPDTGGGYPWANYPYDYWNLWVNHTGTSQDRGELNLDQIAANYDVIMFKHCFPVSGIGPDSGTASVSSSYKSIANYKLQYAALKARMKNDFPTKKFILWTGAALTKGSISGTDAEKLVIAQRAQDFFNWVKTTWDEPGDNIFIWDFYALETAGAVPYMNDAYANALNDSHPNGAFSSTVAPYISQRIVDVIEGRGDTGSITGQ